MFFSRLNFTLNHSSFKSVNTLSDYLISTNSEYGYIGYLQFVGFYPGLYYFKNTSIFMENSIYDNKDSKYGYNNLPVIYSEIMSDYFIIQACKFLNTMNELDGGVIHKL